MFRRTALALLLSACPHALAGAAFADPLEMRLRIDSAPSASAIAAETDLRVRQAQSGALIVERADTSASSDRFDRAPRAIRHRGAIYSQHAHFRQPAATDRAARVGIHGAQPPPIA